MTADDTLGGVLGPRPAKPSPQAPKAASAAPGPSSAHREQSTGRCIGCRHPSGSTCGGCGSFVDDGWDGRITAAPVPGDLLDWRPPTAGPTRQDTWPDYPRAGVAWCAVCLESWAWSYEVPDRLNTDEAHARARLHVVEVHEQPDLGATLSAFLR